MSDNVIIHKFDQYPIFLGTLAFTLLLPLTSIWELISTGTIDFFHRPTPHRPVPQWLIYSGGWCLFFWLSHLIFIPSMKAIFKGYVFKLQGDNIFLDGVWIKAHDILDISEVGNRGKVTTHDRDFYVVYRLSKKGERDFSAFKEKLHIRTS